jgi:hypothetical protein
VRRRREGEGRRGTDRAPSVWGRPFFSCLANEKGTKQKVDRATKCYAGCAKEKSKPPEDGNGKPKSVSSRLRFLAWPGQTAPVAVSLC